MVSRCDTCGKTFSATGGLRQHFLRSEPCRQNATEGAYAIKKDDQVELVQIDASDLANAVSFDNLFESFALLLSLRLAWNNFWPLPDEIILINLPTSGMSRPSRVTSGQRRLVREFIISLFYKV